MFKSYRPETLDEALDIMNKETCHVFAGGTDLMIRKREWQGAERKFTQPVVYINHLSELKGIHEFEDSYEIMTLTTQADIVRSDLPEYIRYPYSLMSSPAIRNVATVGGNIVNAASVADSLPVFIALDAEVELISIKGKRRIPVSEFVVDKYKTLRESNEILSKVIIKKHTYKSFYYKKLGQRKASILSKLSVFILHNDCEDVKIAIGAVNDKVIRDKSLEEEFQNTKDIGSLVRALKLHMKSVDDKRSTKQYRETVALNLIEEYFKGELDEL